MKILIIHVFLLILIPDNAAASLFPPIAYMLLPNAVLEEIKMPAVGMAAISIERFFEYQFENVQV